MSGFNHHTLVLPVHELCMNEIIQYIVCVPLLLSCIIVIIQFICVVAHSSISFFLVFHCMNIQCLIGDILLLQIHSTTDDSLSVFPLFVIFPDVDSVAK